MFGMPFILTLFFLLSSAFATSTFQNPSPDTAPTNATIDTRNIASNGLIAYMTPFFKWAQREGRKPFSKLDDSTNARLLKITLEGDSTPFFGVKTYTARYSYPKKLSSEIVVSFRILNDYFEWGFGPATSGKIARLDLNSVKVEPAVAIAVISNENRGYIIFESCDIVVVDGEPASQQPFYECRMSLEREVTKLPKTITRRVSAQTSDYVQGFAPE